MATLGTSLFSKNNKDGFTRQKALSNTLQARIWWYKSRFNIAIDRPAYEAFCTANPSISPDGSILAKLEEIQQRMGNAAIGTGYSEATADAAEAAPAANIPEWQLKAPKVDLSVKADDGTPHTHSGDGAPYPENFQALVDAVTSGKPIPGIKEIPDTVVRPPVSYRDCTSYLRAPDSLVLFFPSEKKNNYFSQTPNRPTDRPTDRWIMSIN